MAKKRRKKGISAREKARRAGQSSSNYIEVPVQSRPAHEPLDWMIEEPEVEIPVQVERAKPASVEPPRKTIRTGARMKINRAKELFKYGVLKGVIATKAPMEDGWLLLIDDGSGKQPIKTDRGADRIFKTLDAAHNTSRTIGFQTLTVDG